MIKSFVAVIISAIAFVGMAYAQQIKLTKQVKHALTFADTAQIKADIKYLADDKLLGRLPGTPGYQMAVDYVIARLKALNVKPAGENNTWLQQVKLRKAITNNAELAFTGATNTAALKVGTDYNILPNPALPQVKLNAGLAFAGYGISEPILGYDDYAGLDAKGKIVLIVRGSPDKFTSSIAAHAMSTTQVLKSAAEHGAIGVIICSTDSTSRLSRINRGIYSVIDQNGAVAVSGIYYSAQISMLGLFNYALFNSLLAQTGKTLPAILSDLKAGKSNSFAINAGVNVSFNSVYQDVMSYNVIGKLTGTDAKLSKEYVVHSAHLDHLGVGQPVKEDSIYNGAHDNASGVASVLGIATIYKNLKLKPKRSILFVLMTGEEMGDLGSGYFAKYPTVPQKNIVADVNTDMPTIIAPLLSVTALGAEHSSLAKQVDQAAGYLGLTVEPDPEPKQARFTRSDQYSFVVEGIPALHIKYGSKTLDGKNNLNEIVAPWRAKYYHKPQDDINGIFDFGAGKKYAQLNFLIGYLVAQNPSRPTWNAGDIFAKK